MLQTLITVIKGLILTCRPASGGNQVTDDDYNDTHNLTQLSLHEKNRIARKLKEITSVTITLLDPQGTHLKPFMHHSH